MNETQTSLSENLRALPRGAWILFFGTFLNKFGTFVLPFLAIYMTRLGYTPAQAGLATGRRRLTKQPVVSQEDHELPREAFTASDKVAANRSIPKL